MSKKKLARSKRYRPTIARREVERLLRQFDEHGSVVLSTRTGGAQVLKLALDSFSDSGRSAALLDDELCEIDVLLMKAGYEPGNAVRDLARLIKRVKQLERDLKRRLL